MKAEKGGRVFGKLKSLYGSSFEELIRSHSKIMWQEDEARSKMDNLQFDKISNIEDNKQEIVEAAAAVVELNYYSEGSLASKETDYSYEMVRDQIECLASRVAKGIISAKNTDE